MQARLPLAALLVAQRFNTALAACWRRRRRARPSGDPLSFGGGALGGMEGGRLAGAARSALRSARRRQPQRPKRQPQ
ncbi:MAG: hypothetical protein ACLSVD_03390 [Eggerthellaceae bacterium]